MSISSLCDKTIIVQRTTQSITATGAYEETFAMQMEIKARIQPMSASELIKMGRQATDRGVKIYCIPSGIQEPDRITYGTRTYEIVGVRDTDEQGRLCVIDAVEVL